MKLGDVTPEAVLELARDLGWPRIEYGGRVLADEGDWRAERFLDGSRRVDLFKELARLHRSRMVKR